MTSIFDLLTSNEMNKQYELNFKLHPPCWLTIVSYNENTPYVTEIISVPLLQRLKHYPIKIMHTVDVVFLLFSQFSSMIPSWKKHY